MDDGSNSLSIKAIINKTVNKTLKIRTAKPSSLLYPFLHSDYIHLQLQQTEMRRLLHSNILFLLLDSSCPNTKQTKRRKSTAEKVHLFPQHR